MENENLILESKMIDVASHRNYKEATFLISVLDEPDLYGRIIPEDAGKKYCETIIGYPIVAKLKKNIFGQVSDFEGHAVIEVKAKNGKKIKRFGTTAIGAVLNAWVEEREIDGFDEPKKCILCSAKLWSSRFPEYFKVFDKLWESGKVASSWELTATKVEKKGEFKIYKVFEFISNCLLGSAKIPAVPGAGAIEYAEYEDDYDIELAEALEKDLANFNINNEEEKEDVNLVEKTKNVVTTEDTSLTENTVPETAESTVEENPETTSTATNTGEAEVTGGVTEEVASLTDGDLFRLISDACRKAVECDWGYVSYWFPEEHTVWFKLGNAPALDYKLFTYQVENDEVTVSEPEDVKLTVSVADVNDVVAEKDEKIGALTAELELKDSAVIKAGEKISKLNVEISELIPYKEQVETAERERIETEIAEEKKSLKATMMKSNLFTEEEIAEDEIAELIDARDKTAINNLIAERYIASFDSDETSVAEQEDEEEVTTSTASLETDDIDENPSVFMKKFLSRK